MGQLTNKDRRSAQDQDSEGGIVKRKVEIGTILTSTKNPNHTIALLNHQGPKLVIRDNILCKMTKT